MDITINKEQHFFVIYVTEMTFPYFNKLNNVTITY